MIAAYKSNSSVSNDKNRASTVGSSPGPSKHLLFHVCRPGATFSPGPASICHTFVLRAERDRSECANKATIAPCSLLKNSIPCAG